MKKTMPLLLAAALLFGGVTALEIHSAQAKATHQTLGAAPDFTLKNAKTGKTTKLSDFKGKVRLLNFWATWCPPCRGEIPDMVKVQKEFQKKGLQIIGASVDQGGPTVVQAFAKANNINYPLVMADETVVDAYGGIRGIPTTFLIDRQGQIVKKFVGPLSKEQFEQEIKPLL